MILHDYQFGLKLIAGNTPRREFVIDAEAVRAPDKVLSDWVVASYRPGEGNTPAAMPPAAPTGTSPPLP